MGEEERGPFKDWVRVVGSIVGGVRIQCLSAALVSDRPTGRSATTGQTMTANYVRYIVVYPHPSVPKGERIRRIKLDSEARGETLCELLKSKYPEHSSDLRSATLWKASRSTVARLPP